MKLAPKNLKEICDSCRIYGENQTKLIKEFLEKYADTNLTVKDQPNARNNEKLYYTDDGKLVLLTVPPHSFMDADSWGHYRVDGKITLFDEKKLHDFSEDGTDYIEWAEEGINPMELYKRDGIWWKFPGSHLGESQITIPTQEGRRIKRMDDGKIKFTLIQSSQKGTTVKYNSKGKLESVVFPDKSGKKILKKGLRAKIAALKTGTPLNLKTGGRK